MVLKHDKTSRQIVKDPTRGNKILDICITDLWMYYRTPVIIPAIPIDDGKKGVPSDHKGVLIVPVESTLSEDPDVEYKIVKLQ